MHEGKRQTKQKGKQQIGVLRRKKNMIFICDAEKSSYLDSQNNHRSMIIECLTLPNCIAYLLHSS